MEARHGNEQRKVPITHQTGYGDFDGGSVTGHLRIEQGSCQHLKKNKSNIFNQLNKIKLLFYMAISLNLAKRLIRPDQIASPLSISF
jgi:hypothetical protein